MFFQATFALYLCSFKDSQKSHSESEVCRVCQHIEWTCRVDKIKSQWKCISILTKRLDWWTRSWTYEQVVLLQMNSTVSIFLYIFSIFQCRMFIDIFFYLIEWLLHFFNAVEFTELVGRPFARNRQVLEEKLAQMIDVKFIFGKYISISSKSRHVRE